MRVWKCIYKSRRHLQVPKACIMGRQADMVSMINVVFFCAMCSRTYGWQNLRCHDCSLHERTMIGTCPLTAETFTSPRQAVVHPIQCITTILENGCSWLSTKRASQESHRAYRAYRAYDGDENNRQVVNLSPESDMFSRSSLDSDEYHAANILMRLSKAHARGIIKRRRIQQNCGRCRECLDKRKFGGPGKRKLGCKSSLRVLSAYAFVH